MTPRNILYHLTIGCSTLASVAVFCIVCIVQDDVGVSTFAGKNHLFARILPILTLCTIAQFLFARNRRVPIYTTDLLLVGVAGYLLCTYYFVTGGVYTKLMMLGALGVLYLNLRILFNASPRLIRLLTLVIIVSGIVEAVTGLSQLYGLARSNHALFRMTGSFFNPGPYSNYLALIVPIALYHILKSKPQPDIPIGGVGSALRAVDLNRLLHATSWIVVFLSILVLPAARGRIAWVAVTVTGVILILRETPILGLCKNFYRRRKGLSWVIGICGVAVPLIVAVGIYNFKRDSANGRLLIWKVITTQMIPSNPLVGVGQGYFAGYYGDAQMNYFATQKESESERRVAGSPEYAFNDSLQIVAEAGWIGGVLFAGILGLTLYGLARMRSALFYGLVSLLILMQASYPLNLLPFCILLIFFTAAAQDGFQKPVFYLQKPVIPAILLCGVLVWSLFAARG